MPVCIHCAVPVPSLYLRYGKDHIVPAPCRSSICGPSTDSQGTEEVVLADEYLEHGITIVILDLILAKPRAYRHLLFNREYQDINAAVSSKERGATDLLKQFLALGLVDAYIRWFYLCVEPVLGILQPDSTVSRSRLSELLDSLPLSAGIFFPSYVQTETQGGDSPTIPPMCSTEWIWFTLPSLTQEDQMLSTLVSYLNVMVVTLIESAVLHVAVCTVTRLLTSKRTDTATGGHAKAETPTSAKLSFWQPSKALILSQLSPLILLLFVLLWSSSFPHSNASAIRSNSSLQSRSVIWIIRTLLSSLNAGIAIATLVPSRTVPAATRPNVWLTPFILGTGWAAQAFTSWGLYQVSSLSVMNA